MVCVRFTTRHFEESRKVVNFFKTSFNTIHCVAGVGVSAQNGGAAKADLLAAMTADRDKWMHHSQDLLVSILGVCL